MILENGTIRTLDAALPTARALAIAAEICIYTNNNVTIETL